MLNEQSRLTLFLLQLHQTWFITVIVQLYKPLLEPTDCQFIHLLGQLYYWANLSGGWGGGAVLQPKTWVSMGLLAIFSPPSAMKINSDKTVGKARKTHHSSCLFMRVLWTWPYL